MWKGLSLLAASEVRDSYQRYMAAAVWTLVAALAGLAALAFALVAAHGWLSLEMSSISASLVIAAALGVVALIFLGVAAAARKRPVRPSPVASSALIAAPYALSMATRRLNFSTLAILGVVAAGAFFGRQLGRD